ncbi:uncharacterized protein EDB93DRAFT_1340363 [Suillus bovinus]|uniref:uncharacterized protein n=1 Tax=Suillus bovinus TaxID=48563 RepID=UPI001B864A5E|nr:uncharacterized protein EDB93DRAFT_1340363 [Suillus bovinus]KAG2130824.1 hypothetical protein EDB93DRAFT_1340363 [Suillus bovinus]
MTIVSNDPSWWPLFYRLVESSQILKLTQSNLGYVFPVAAVVGVVYDWALTFGQEVELVWPWAGPSRAQPRPKSRPEQGLGLGLDSEKPKPAALIIFTQERKENLSAMGTVLLLLHTNITGMLCLKIQTRQFSMWAAACMGPSPGFGPAWAHGSGLKSGEPKPPQAEPKPGL